MQDDRQRNFDLGAPQGTFYRPLPTRYVGDGASVGFGEAVRRALRSSVYGRASRSEFWYFWLFCFILNICSLIIFGMVLDLQPVDNFVQFMISLFVTIAFVRRLHDVNRSGWWVLIAFTLIGVIPLFIWSVKKGDPRPNRFDIAGRGTRPVTIAAPDTTAAIDQVERLQQLRIGGAITEDEFQALKKRAL